MSGEAGSNPFPGPQPYRAADRPYFSGRKDLSQRLLNRILADPCVTLFGPSGSGKSSLMQASVIPLLMEQHGFRAVLIDGWLADEAPLERLVRAMFAQLELGDPPEGMSPRELLDEALRLAERRSERPILIFLDQLEQLLLPDRSADQLHELLEALRCSRSRPCGDSAGPGLARGLPGALPGRGARQPGAAGSGVPVGAAQGEGDGEGGVPGGCPRERLRGSGALRSSGR